MLELLLAVALSSPTPTPPPIIVTTKTSALCNAVRTIVAPSIQGLATQDLMIDQGRELLQDMAHMDVAHANAWVDLDNMRLMNVVDGVAANNIKIHGLLQKLADVSLKDPTEADELAKLRSRLLVIADDQTIALNDFSATADTKALEDIQGFKNPMARSLQPDLQADRELETPEAQHAQRQVLNEFSYGNLISADAFGNVALDVALKQSANGREESTIIALVRPLVDRCR